MDDLNVLAAKAAIGKMITDGYFSISAVDKAMKLLGCPRGGNEYDILSAIHCVNFRDLDPALYAAIPGLLNIVLRNDAIDWGCVFREPSTAPLLEAKKQDRGIVAWLRR
jgi:hypothetical protein